MGGSPSTHVANAYDKPVYVKAEAERCDLPLASYSVSLGVEGEYFQTNHHGTGLNVTLKLGLVH